MKKKIIVFTALIGYLFIIIATYLMTIEIPSLENNILESDAVIKRIDDKLLRGLIIHSDLKISEIKKRINIQELNSFILQNVGIVEQEELKGRITVSLYDLIKMFSTLFIMDELAVADSVIIIKADEVFQEQESFEEKKGKLEGLLLECKYNIDTRLSSIQEKRKEEIEQRKIFKNKKENIYGLFIWFQIIGLILLSFTGILEMTVKTE